METFLQIIIVLTLLAIPVIGLLKALIAKSWKYNISQDLKTMLFMGFMFMIPVLMVLNAGSSFQMKEEIIKTNSDHWNKIDEQIKQLRKIQQSLNKTNNKLKDEQVEVLVKENIFFTSYNPERWQTDSTPCIAGGTWYNICEMAKQGKRVIALSQEMIQWSIIWKNWSFKKWDVVILKSEKEDSRCNGEFIVGDAMNIRFRNRWDIFFLDKKDNISCYADIYKKI